MRRKDIAYGEREIEGPLATRMLESGLAATDHFEKTAGDTNQMDMLERLLQSLDGYMPLLTVLAITCIILWVANRLLMSRVVNTSTDSRLPRQLTMLVLTAIGIIAVILSLPISETTRGELLSLLGLVLTGVIALSSTTFVSNVMAGLMLRSVKSFRLGDFIHAGEHFGRVTERGLFHTEIQTEDRDLVTLPNLFLASSPITVVRSSGTIISCELSLGYDVPHHEVEPLLKEAALNCELQDPFVQIRKLGDFSVTYRVAAYYPEVKHILTMRSKLHQKVLDQLHGAGIEIVSPTFMNQRQFNSGEQFLATPKRPDPFEEQHPPPEALIFDKADRAEKIHVLKSEAEVLAGEIKTLEAQLSKAENGSKPALKAQIEKRNKRIELLEKIVHKAKEETND
ncbi:MAG: mechanosensitive ion channel [Pseudomonadales bacterium]|nr:mechanosensitive ion channel [Pseudomonadales bacterium]